MAIDYELRRRTGRASNATVRNWDDIVGSVGYAPSIKEGPPPARSPRNVEYRLKRYRAQLLGCCVGETLAQLGECLLRMPVARAEGDRPVPGPALTPLLPYYLARQYSRALGIRLPAEGAIVSHCALALAEEDSGYAPLETWAPTPEAYRRYSDRRPPPDAALAEAPQHTIRELALLPDAAACLTWLAAGYPLAIGCDFPRGILQTRDDGYFDCSGGPGDVGHAVVWYDYDQVQDVAIIGNHWANVRWGRKSNDPELPPECEGYDNVGWCRLSDLLTLFTPALMSRGRTEAVVVNTVEGWEPRVRSFAEVL